MKEEKTAATEVVKLRERLGQFQKQGRKLDDIGWLCVAVVLGAVIVFLAFCVRNESVIWSFTALGIMLRCKDILQPRSESMSFS